MSQKRIRSINWDEEEKKLLRSVLKDYATIIENKSLDTNTSKAKTKAWEEVHRRFNELNGLPRQLGKLKIQWKTMKINARKSHSIYRQETNKTGGGPKPTTPDDEVTDIKDLLNPAELLRDHNIYDSDGIDQNDYVNAMVSHSKMLKEEARKRQLEMAEEEHLIKMAIHAEKLKSAILEREIIELKKKQEEKNLESISTI